MTRWVAAVALAVGGCGAPTADWYVDDRFSADERAEVERGAAWLHQQAGLPAPTFASYSVTSADARPRTIRREPLPGYPVAQHGGLCTSPDGRGTIYLWPDPASPNVAGTTAHEMAHCALGFVDGYHASDAPTDGIMRVLDPMLWTESERAQCRASARCLSK